MTAAPQAGRSEDGGGGALPTMGVQAERSFARHRLNIGSQS